MVNFWLNFLLIFVSWVFTFMEQGLQIHSLFFSALFFGLYFLIPLLNEKIKKIIFVLFPIITLAAFPFSTFSWLIYLSITFQIADLMSRRELISYLFYVALFVLIPPFFSENFWAFGFGLILMSHFGVVIVYFKQRAEENVEQKEEYKKLFQMYRTSKRQVSYLEKVTRQEERQQIAREIHDAVGHKLTALVMQIEVARLKAEDEKVSQQFSDLKILAQESLQDTREAVKALKSEETIGLQAVIQLIRKIEAESQINIAITLQSGVLGAALNNEQSVTIYRVVQEALTNMMRHSEARFAEIEFQIIAHREFRFTVSHKTKKIIQIREGFGIKNMRDRLERVDGRLSLYQEDSVFTVKGQFPLEENEND